MQQIATVLRTLPDRSAQIVILRDSACGSCEGCSGCGAARQRLIVTAENSIDANVGDRVQVQTATKTVLGMALAVYLLPIVLFFVGYAVGALIAWRPAICGVLGFLLAIPLTVLLDRLMHKRKTVRFVLTGFVGE